MAASVPVPKKTAADRGKYGKSAKIVSGTSRSSKAGLLFPVGRIKRKLKEVMVGQRVGVGSAVYMAAIL